MRQSSLLIFNTALLFSRMALTFGIGIYCTRLLVQLLGHADFGLLSALGASGTLLLITSRSLESSSQRHLAHAIGSGNREQLGRVFANTLAVFAGLATCLLMVAAAAGPALLGAINIPPERQHAATLVYTFTMLGLAVTTVGIPFRSVFAAHQEMAAVASFETWRSILNLACALAMLATDGDRLVVYAGAKFVSTLLQSGANTLSCMWRHPESRLPWRGIERKALVDIARFAGWATLLRFARPLHTQASAVLLGIASTPAAMAAYGVAMKMTEYQTTLAQLIPRVVQPAMTAMEARGERARTQLLAILTGKYSTLLLLYLIVPVCLEMDELLRLWLSSVPDDAAFYGSLTLIALTVQVPSSGFERAAFAHGDVGRFALFNSGLWASCFALSAFLMMGLELGPRSLPLTVLAVSVVQLPMRLANGGPLIGVGFGRWFRESLGPLLATLAIGLAGAVAVRAALPEGPLRLVAVALGYAVCATPATWLIAVGSEERAMLVRAAGAALPKLRKRLAF